MDESTVELRVRYAETDRMGRAHHAVHLVWAEAGRTSWMRDRGIDYAELEDRGVYLPVSRVEVDYRGGVGYDEAVRVRCWPDSVGSRRVTFGYDFERADDGETVARAEIDLVCVGDDGRVRRLPDDVRGVLDGGGAAG